MANDLGKGVFCVVLGATLAVAVPKVVPMLIKNAKDLDNPNKFNLINQFSDSFYYNIDGDSLSYEEQITQDLMYSQKNIESEQEALAFFKQLEIQAGKYCEKFEEVRSQKGLQIFFDLGIEFIIMRKEYKGYFFEELSVQGHGEVCRIFEHIGYMKKYGRPEYKIKVPELTYPQALNKTIHFFNNRH